MVLPTLAWPRYEKESRGGGILQAVRFPREGQNRVNMSALSWSLSSRVEMEDLLHSVNSSP